MKEIVKKKIQPPKPEPITFGKCRLVSRNFNAVPETATPDQFREPYGFYKYEPLETFSLEKDIYPILKNDVKSNALFYQTPLSIDIFVLKTGKLPAIIQQKATVESLVNLSKKSKEKPLVVINRQEYIFHEKTALGNLFFIDKGQTQIRNIAFEGNTYFHLQLPLFILGGGYDYKKESELLYMMCSDSDFNDYLENNDNDNQVSSPSQVHLFFPDEIEQQVLDSNISKRFGGIAYPYYQGQVESINPIAPDATFTLRKFIEDCEDVSEVFFEQIFEQNTVTGGFKLQEIANLNPNQIRRYEYEVSYRFNNATSSIYIQPSVLKIYGSVRVGEINLRVANTSNFIDVWSGFVFRKTDPTPIIEDIGNTLYLDGGEEGKPSGCPPRYGGEE